MYDEKIYTIEELKAMLDDKGEPRFVFHADDLPSAREYVLAEDTALGSWGPPAGRGLILIFICWGGSDVHNLLNMLSHRSEMKLLGVYYQRPKLMDGPGTDPATCPVWEVKTKDDLPNWYMPPNYGGPQPGEDSKPFTWQGHRDESVAYQAISRDGIVAILEKWIKQRPGLEVENYGGSYAAMKTDANSISLQRQRAEKALEEFKNLPWNAPLMIEESHSAFSGRLTFKADWSIEYCTGQYFPCEYRLAMAVVLESYNYAMQYRNVPAQE